jgi:hypothetical protein
MVAHHTTYKGFSDNPNTPWPAGWDCDPCFLQWLCGACHEYVHGHSEDDPAASITWAELERRIKAL